jgi:hypothetical protein
VYSLSAGAGTAIVSCEVAPGWITGCPRANVDCEVTVIGPSGRMLATLNAPGVESPVGLGVGPTPVTLPTSGS